MIIDMLAAYRLTRLLQKDSFPPALALRTWVEDEGPGWLREMWECPWCLGMWVSLLVVMRRREGFASALRRALAVNVAVGVLRETEEVLEVKWLS